MDEKRMRGRYESLTVAAIPKRRDCSAANHLVFLFLDLLLTLISTLYTEVPLIEMNVKVDMDKKDVDRYE